MDFSLFLVLFGTLASGILCQQLPNDFKFNVIPIKQEIRYVDVPFAPPPKIDPIEIGGDEAVPLQLNFRSQSRDFLENQRQQHLQFQQQPVRHHAVVNQNPQHGRAQTIQFQTQSVKPRTPVFNPLPQRQNFVQRQQSFNVKPQPQQQKPTFPFNSFFGNGPTPPAIQPSSGNFRFQRIGNEPASFQTTRTVSFGNTLNTPAPAPIKPVSFNAPQPVQSFRVRPIPNGRNLPLFVSTQPQILLANTQQLGPAPQVTTEQLVNNVLQQVNSQPAPAPQSSVEAGVEEEDSVEINAQPAPQPLPVAPAPVAQPQQFVSNRREPIRLQIVPSIRENLNKFAFTQPAAQQQVQAAQAVQVAPQPVAVPQELALNQNQLQRQVISTSEPQPQIDASEIERANNENLLQGIQALLTTGRQSSSALSPSLNSNLDSSLNSFITTLTSKSQADTNPLFINGDKNPAA